MRQIDLLWLAAYVDTVIDAFRLWLERPNARLWMFLFFIVEDSGLFRSRFDIDENGDDAFYM